jgi:hypothetical protein
MLPQTRVPETLAELFRDLVGQDPYSGYLVFSLCCLAVAVAGMVWRSLDRVKHAH